MALFHSSPKLYRSYTAFKFDFFSGTIFAVVENLEEDFSDTMQTIFIFRLNNVDLFVDIYTTLGSTAGTVRMRKFGKLLIRV